MSFLTASAQIPPIRQGDPKVIRGWIMYDWANSVYQLTITTAIFPLYFLAVTMTGKSDLVQFFGWTVRNSALYSWTIASSYFLVAVFSPMFSSIADYTGRRKTFMKVFTWLGAIGCGMLFFFDEGTVELGVIAFALGTIGYCGSIVFYNSFLPIIAKAEDQDRISARGYSMGYLGGVVLVLFNLLMIKKKEWFGIQDEDLAVRISFATVSLWWIGFSQITFLRLPKYTFRKEGRSGSLLGNGYSELRTVFRHVVKSRRLTIFLAGFFFMMSGLLTIMAMATAFGKKAVGLTEDVLIPTLILLQLVGILGAWLFARLSGRYGNISALIMTMSVWIFVCAWAYFLTSALEFVIAGGLIGFVMGGSQSLARSTYSKLLPETTDHTSFFSFYDVMEKLAMVLGTFTFGVIDSLTGNMRNCVIAIAVYFILGTIAFLRIGPSALKSRAKSPSLQ